MSSMRTAAWPLVRTAVPIMLSTMLSFLMQVVDLYFVGHLGPHELAAAAVGNLFWNTLQHPVLGCASALDTLLSQSFGASQYSAYGIHAQTGLIAMLALGFPFMLLLGVAEPLLVAVNMDAELASKAGLFCKHLIPGVLPFFAFSSLSKFLQAQDILFPAVAIGAVSNVANALGNWLLIHRLGLGFAGAPVSTSVSRWFQFLALCAYLVLTRRALAPTLPPWRIKWRALPYRFSQFFRLGMAGAAMLSLEAWFFEVATFFAASLGTISLDAHITMLNICAFTFLSVPFALGARRPNRNTPLASLLSHLDAMFERLAACAGIAASIRVGQSLGAGRPAEAKATANVTIALVLTVMSTIAVIKVSCRAFLGYLFSQDPRVVAKVASLAPIAALFQVSDGLQAAIAGVMRGQGRQALVAWLNLAGFWVLGLGVGIFLTFGPPRLGVEGLWWGMAAGLTATSLLGVCMLSRTDWVSQARAAKARSIGGGGGGSGSSSSSSGGGGGGGSSSTMGGTEVSIEATPAVTEMVAAAMDKSAGTVDSTGADDRVRPTQVLD